MLCRGIERAWSGGTPAWPVVVRPGAVEVRLLPLARPIRRRGTGSARRPVAVAGLVGAMFVALALATAARAQQDGRDLHAYWDGRCGYCHGDSADFARRTLGVEGGRLVGRQHRADLRPFLVNHYLDDALVEPVAAMLAAQVTARPVFRQSCSKCHDTAAEFARRSLASRDGRLVGVATGRAVAESLKQHGGLPAAEQAAMVGTLERVLRETGAR